MTANNQTLQWRQGKIAKKLDADYGRTHPQVTPGRYMVMPRMDGRECFRALRAPPPGVRAILSSGYSREGRAQTILDEGMAGFIQKPYRIDELAAAVHAALVN